MSSIAMHRFQGIARDVAIAAGLGCSADLACQIVWEKKRLEDVDARRVVAVTVFSGVYIGSICNIVYPFYPKLAARLFGSHKQLSAKSLGIFSTMMDNFVHVPILYLPSYFVTVGCIQGQSASEMEEVFRTEYTSTLTSCWMFWVPFMAVNFGVLPLTHQVRAVAAANLFWTMTLDYLTHQNHGKLQPILAVDCTKHASNGPSISFENKLPPFFFTRRRSSSLSEIQALNTM